jgi:hypothetical protein
MMELRMLPVLVALGAALAVPAATHASVGSTYGDYSKDGTINGCDYSSSDLQIALGSVPTDVAQYDPRFKNALNNALAQRAAGCGGTAGAGGVADQNKKAAAAANGSPKPPVASPAAVPASDTNLGSSDHGFPLALGVLAALVAMIIAATGLVAYARGEWGYAGRRRFFSFFSDYYWGIRDTIGR